MATEQKDRFRDALEAVADGSARRIEGNMTIGGRAWHYQLGFHKESFVGTVKVRSLYAYFSDTPDLTSATLTREVITTTTGGKHGRKIETGN